MFAQVCSRLPFLAPAALVIKRPELILFCGPSVVLSALFTAGLREQKVASRLGT